jgi:hypothetical protein
MHTTRRNFLQQCSSGLMLSIGSPVAFADPTNDQCMNAPINVVVPKDPQSVLMAARSPGYPYRLRKAVLTLIADHYQGRRLPVWGKHYEDVELEKRILNIVYWVLHSVHEYATLYPIDPAWLLAQIMAESFFYEFAVSPALAVGICQITQPTAEAYGLLCAGSRAEHARPPYRLPELANKAQLYYDLRQARRRMSRRKPAQQLTLEDALAELSAENKTVDPAIVAEQLRYIRELEALDQRRYEARDAFRQYLKANCEGRNIFEDADLAFLLGYEQRFTYRAPIDVMTQLMTRALRARNGNILAATASYNAGLGNTRANGLYAPYGRIPEFAETITYTHKVLINYQEIDRRL